MPAVTLTCDCLQPCRSLVVIQNVHFLCFGSLSLLLLQSILDMDIVKPGPQRAEAMTAHNMEMLAGLTALQASLSPVTGYNFGPHVLSCGPYGTAWLLTH